MPVDPASALDLRLNHNLTFAEIGKIQGVSKQAIHQQLSKLLPDVSEVDSFQEYRADILAASQINLLKALNSLDPAEQKELVKRRGMVDYGILQDKEYQARGLSDVNTRPLIQINIGVKPVDNSDDNKVIDVQSGGKVIDTGR